MSDEEAESITISGHYTDDGQCDHISVYFANEAVSREDIAAIVTAIVNAHCSVYERGIDGIPNDPAGIEKYNLNTRKEWFGN